MVRGENQDEGEMNWGWRTVEMGGCLVRRGGGGFWIFVRFRSGRLRGMLEGAVLRSALCRCFMIWRR